MELATALSSASYHIRMERFLEIEDECKRKNIMLLTHGYADSTPKHDVAKIIRERGEKVLKGEIQADDTLSPLDLHQPARAAAYS